MARGPTIRCPVTGIPVKRLDERYLDDDGKFNTAAYSDCNLYDKASIAAAAGYSVRYYFEVVVTDGTSSFHLHQIKQQNGRVVGYATHDNSAEFGRKQHRARTLEAQTGCSLPVLSDVSSGSVR